MLIKVSCIIENELNILCFVLFFAKTLMYVFPSPNDQKGGKLVSVGES